MICTRRRSSEIRLTRHLTQFRQSSAHYLRTRTLRNDCCWSGCKYSAMAIGVSPRLLAMFWSAPYETNRRAVDNFNERTLKIKIEGAQCLRHLVKRRTPRVMEWCEFDRWCSDPYRRRARSSDIHRDRDEQRWSMLDRLGLSNSDHETTECQEFLKQR